MCATILYRKLIKGRLYPKAARNGPYAFAQEVTRVQGKIVKVPEGQDVIERDETEGKGVIEKPEGTPNGDNAGEPT